MIRYRTKQRLCTKLIKTEEGMWFSYFQPEKNLQNVVVDCSAWKSTTFSTELPEKVVTFR